MIRHTVSFALAHEPGSPEEADFLATARAVLSGVPGVRDLVVSRQVSPRSPHAFHLSMVFATRADYAAYDAHPAHRAFVASRWEAEVTDFQELDLEPLEG
jgi:hypothetical protein